MITRYGKIEKVTPTIAYLRKFNYEEYTKEESKLTEYCDDYFLSDVTSSIRISSSVYNELFDAAGEPCILELLIDEVGLVHTAKIYKTFEQLKNKAEEVAKQTNTHKVNIDLMLTNSQKIIRDKLRVILSVLMDMEKLTGIVEKEVLLNELESKHKISRIEAEHMINKLLREGTIYEPREGGWLKKV